MGTGYKQPSWRDEWRTNHDRVKLQISRLCSWTSLPAQFEVFNLLSHFIPQEGLSSMEKEVTKENRRKQKELAEIKVLCCCPSHYNLLAMCIWGGK